MGTTGIGAALFGTTRQAVLRLLFGHAEQRFYQRQLIRILCVGSGSVQRELQRMVDAGIVTRSSEGHQTYFQANARSPVFEELRGLVRKTFGVADVLRDALAPMAQKIGLAFIYGSIAAGSERANSDIDLMIVGERLSLSDAVNTLAEVQELLGREINPSIYQTSEFCRKLAEGHHFLASIVSGPKIFLIGDKHELARLAQIRVGEGAQVKPARDRRPARSRR